MGKTNQLPDPEPGTYGAWLKQMGDEDGVDLLGLLEKMAAGDRKAAEAAVAYMRRRPEVAEAVLAHSGTAQRAWLDYASSDPFTRFSLEERARRTRRELLGERPTPLERLLVERIVICSLQVQIAEAQYVGVMKGSTTFAKAKFYEDLQDRAQRRYLAAIKALAQVRRLQLPPVSQLNVATNQVNLAQPGSVATGQVPAASAPALPDHDAVTIDDVLTGRDVESVVNECAGKAETG